MKNKANMKPILEYVSREKAREARKQLLLDLEAIRIFFVRYKRYTERDVLRHDEMAAIS